MLAANAPTFGSASATASATGLRATPFLRRALDNACIYAFSCGANHGTSVIFAPSLLAQAQLTGWDSAPVYRGLWPRRKTVITLSQRRSYINEAKRSNRN